MRILFLPRKIDLVLSKGRHARVEGRPLSMRAGAVPIATGLV
jgi:hypothetical protein